MISTVQITEFAKKYKIAESVILREYLQIWFLSQLYSEPASNNIYFKGGTAIHLLFGAPRFSEDLDFTVTLTEPEFEEKIINRFFPSLAKLESVSIKQKSSIAGKTFQLSSKHPTSNYPIFINLDFSFREQVYEPTKSILPTEYPVLFTSLVSHLSGSELISEKIRVILKRQKGRDLYDLWYLLTKNFSINRELIQAKLDYYKIKFNEKELKETISKFPEAVFINDLKPFVGGTERSKLPEIYKYIVSFLDGSEF